MRYLLFVCEGLGDEPLADLDGRTPLEAAKTPVLHDLAHRGSVGTVSFVPPNRVSTPDVACLSILGYDPQEVYTGLAPLEAPAFGISMDDREVVFRADLVTLLDEALMDAAAGKILEREAGILMREISAKFSDEKFKFVTGLGYKNFLVVKDPILTDEMDELDCPAPSQCAGQKISKCLPKGHGSVVLIKLMKDVGEFLENHEINRVRIDLTENPANYLWLWGQGRKPKLAGFEKKHNIRGAFHAQADFIKGIAKSVGLAPIKNLETMPRGQEFVFFYFGSGSESRAGLDLKSKIKRIEEFDAFVGHALKACQNEPDLRIGVMGDLSESLTQKNVSRNPVPVLLCGSGIAAGNHAAFNEKICGQAKSFVDKGHEFLNYFLKQ